MAVQASQHFKQKSIISRAYDAFCTFYVKQNNFNKKPPLLISHLEPADVPPVLLWRVL